MAAEGGDREKLQRENGDQEVDAAYSPGKGTSGGVLPWAARAEAILQGRSQVEGCLRDSISSDKKMGRQAVLSQ